MFEPERGYLQAWLTTDALLGDEDPGMKFMRCLRFPILSYRKPPPPTHPDKV